jgi:hypothetical protein
MSSSASTLSRVALVAAVALVAVQAAFAADRQPVKLTAADQAHAKAATLRLADLGSGWKGGAVKPDLSPDDSCPAKRSDLVITGAAKTEFTGQGAKVVSEANVLRSAAMVAADWKRTVGNAAYMACVRREALKTPGAKVISFTRMSFPKLAPLAVRYRMVVDYGTTASPVRVVMDVIFIGSGRTELSLLVSAQYAERADVDLAGRGLAKLLVARAKA